MRYAAILFLSFLFICSCASTPFAEEPAQNTVEPAAPEAPAPVAPEAEKQRLAVLDMEDTTGDIDAESLAQATDYLRVLVVQSQRFIVVNDEEKQALIRELRKESHGEQYDESQRVPLGQRVAANIALITTILKLQEKYILKAELVDLAKESIIAGASEEFDPDTFQQAIEAVAQTVTTEKETPADTMVATAPAEEVAPADIPVNDGTEVAADYSGDEYHDHHDGGGVNFVIINLVSSRHGHEPNPWYQRAEERRRERERREHAEHQHHADEPTHHHADEPSHEHIDGAMHEKEEEPPANDATPPSVEKPIKFKLVKKPILFRAPAKKQPSSGAVDAQPAPFKVLPKTTRDEPAPAYTLPPKKEKAANASPSPVFRIEPKKSEPKRSEPSPSTVDPDKKGGPFFINRTEPAKEQPAFHRQEPVRTYNKSEPAASPRPIFTPSKSVTPTPSSNSSSSKKKKDDDKDDDDDDKKKEKKKPSTGNIFIPRKR